MHTFLSNLANRQTDRQTDKQMRAKTYTSSFVGGKQCWLPIDSPNCNVISNAGIVGQPFSQERID